MMMFKKLKTIMKISLISSLFLPLLSLATVQDEASMAWGSSQDPSSYSNVDAFAPSHIFFDFAVDFDESATVGTITHTLSVLEAGVNTTTVYFDVWDAVQVDLAEFSLGGGDFESVDFEITTPNPNIGNALAVMLPMSMMAGDEFYIRFAYKSLPGTTALSWLTPEQTAGKTLPFVYSLCQMNFCRDWAPMMDTPSQKITYNATIVAPSEFVVSMSGNMTSTTPLNDTHTLTTFECNEKIPSYQLALIVGDLVQQALSDRVIVFAEAPYLEAAVKEFEDLPAVLDSTEAYLTPYIWGKYSIFVMPPSFPWGVSVQHNFYVLLLNAQSRYSLLISSFFQLLPCVRVWSISTPIKSRIHYLRETSPCSKLQYTRSLTAGLEMTWGARTG
jgi:aminopeptidase N